MEFPLRLRVGLGMPASTGDPRHPRFVEPSIDTIEVKAFARLSLRLLARVLARHSSAGAFSREPLDKSLEVVGLPRGQESLGTLPASLTQAFYSAFAVATKPFANASARNMEQRGDLGGGSFALLEQGKGQVADFFARVLAGPIQLCEGGGDK